MKKSVLTCDCIFVPPCKQTAEHPVEADIETWVRCALQAFEAKAGIVLKEATLCIAIMNEEAIQDLNTRYRHRPKPTNTLSFPYEVPSRKTPTLLGDIALCDTIIKQEAADVAEPVQAHWAYLTVHSVLHLCGYDHIDPKEAAEMESMEEEIMRLLHIAR